MNEWEKVIAIAQNETTEVGNVCGKLANETNEHIGMRQSEWQCKA